MKKALFVVMALVTVFVSAVPVYAVSSDDYPDLPSGYVESHPYWFIYSYSDGKTYLKMSSNPFVHDGTWVETDSANIYRWTYSAGTWADRFIYTNHNETDPLYSSFLLSSDDILFTGGANIGQVFFPVPPALPEVVEGLTLEGTKSLGTEVVGTMNTLVPFGVGCLALLTALVLLRKKLLLYLQ